MFLLSRAWLSLPKETCDEDRHELCHYTYHRSRYEQNTSYIGITCASADGYYLGRGADKQPSCWMP